MQDKTVVMSGGTSGIGEAAAIAFARQGARVLAVGRDRQRGEAVARAMAEAGCPGEFIAADLLPLADVRRLADAILAITPRVDVLLNNAGGSVPRKTGSADGIEATFALNTVASFALATHLAGALAQAKGRVVNTATGFLGRTRLRVTELVDPPAFSSLGRYAIAKLAVVMVTLEQAERWKADGIGVFPCSRASSSARALEAGARRPIAYENYWHGGARALRHWRNDRAIHSAL